MAGLINIFGTNEHLSSLVEFSNCHVVVDGSNLQHLIGTQNSALSNLPAYEESVANFFKHFLNAGITPHVFFDGPSRSDSYKWGRARERREERLERLSNAPRETKRSVFEIPAPTAVQDIFRDVIYSLGIRSVQVSAKRDYTLEMISHAKYHKAFLVSGNTKFFVEDIPKGFVCIIAGRHQYFESRSQCIMKTFHYKKLTELIGLDKSPNPYALTMWRTALYHRDVFGKFTEQFGKQAHPPQFYPRSRCFWMQSLLSQKCRKVTHLKLLQFFLENKCADAERIVCGQLSPGDRGIAKLFFQQNIAAQLTTPDDVFERIANQIESGSFCDDDLPQWFLRYLTIECKVVPGLMDTLTDRRHYLMALTEDFNRESVNKTTVRLRRIIYGILFSDRKDSGGPVEVLELDREGMELREASLKPIRKLWNPNEQYEGHDVPGLKEMECLPEPERIKLFLLSLGVEESLRQKIDSKEVLYVIAVLRYWSVAAKGVRKQDLLRILLTALLVEKKYSKVSNVFRKPVRLREQEYINLGIDFEPSSVSMLLLGTFAHMHPLAQLQNSTLFGRTLHRLLMQPLGATSDCIETITSEVAFHHIYNLTNRMTEAELEEFVLDLVHEDSRGNFIDTLNLIWDEEARSLGEIILSGFRGDDEL
ncbi:uncharacterized protein LOC100899580 [Galendromus occidentalis]|uniref:Uncharacterized protein LOC100899580 n=1 Tax=Galendromus occidentalis TaxID=34638 RepID=A0AAJ6QY30_9ACAR|nr:uncharacterized protein LOC100899580 [Galendromus occidentalis]